MFSTSANRKGRALAIHYSNLLFLSILCLKILILNLVQPASAVLTTCYDPSGNVRGDVPCNQAAPQSACCAQGWVCTNISLCVAGPTVKLNPGDPEYFEGACTDKTWNSPFCPPFCRTGNLSQNSANGLWNCGDGDWCCSAFSGDTNCCERNTAVFFLGYYENVTTIGGTIGPGFSTAATSQTSTTLSASTAASVTAPLSSSLSSTVPTTPPTTSASVEGSSLGTGAKVGIGVGIVVGVGALGMFGVLLYRQRDHTKKLREQLEGLQSTPSWKDPRSELSASHTAKYLSVMPVHEIGARDYVVELPVDNERSSLR